MIDRRITPEYKVPDNISYVPPVVQIMSNGIKLHCINAGTQEVMRFAMVFEAGTLHQTQAFVATTTGNMLIEGTLNQSSLEIAEKLDFYGASIEVNTDRDYTIISVYCLTKYCNEILQIIADVLKYPVFPQEELEIYKQKRKEALRIEQEKVEFSARKEFLKAIYGANHPYGRSGEVEDYNILHRDLLVDYHRKYLTSSNVFIVLAGNVGEKEKSVIELYFGSETWGNYNPSNTWKEPKGDRNRKQSFTKTDALQSAIRAGRVLFPKNHPDFAGMQVLNTVLGGYFGSRLMRNIREEKGYTYGIYSVIAPLKKSGYLSIVTDTNNEYTSEVVKEIEKEIYLLQTELIPDYELNTVRQYIYGEMLHTLDGPWGQSEVCIDRIQSGLPDNYVEILFSEIQAITSEQLQQLAVKYLKLEDLYEIIVGNNI